MNSKLDIQITICDILKTKFNVKANINPEANVFGRGIAINARDMVYLCVLLEKEYGISFTEQDIDSNGFYTIDGLSHIILKMTTCSQ